MDVEIATYWNVETLYYVFNGVAAIMGGAGFSGILKLVFYFSLAFGMFAYMGGKQLEWVKWFFQALVFVSLLNMPIARVLITDRAGLEPPRTVDHVPFALAVVGQTANSGFGWATRTYETVFGVPDDLALQKGDLAFGHRILKNVNKVVIRDPGLRADLMQFLKECTLYDVKDGAITPDQLTGQTDTWNTIFNNTSPARFVTYDTLTPSPTTATCKNVAVVLKDRVNAGLDSAQAFYGRQNFSRADTDAAASAMFASVIGTSYDWILASSSSASDAMKQAMFNNIWREAGSELPALMNDPARIQELQNMAGAAQAARQADGANGALSMLAQETLPHMRNWLEAIIYAMFPVMVVLMVLVSTEGAKKMVGGYMMALAWIGLWPVLFAVINHLSLMHLRHKMAALKLATGVPFQLSDAFDATLGDELQAIGYMVVLVPFISAAIIKMGQGGFMSVADKMIAGFSGTATAAGSALASGNMSLGQVGMDTVAANSTSMNKYDANSTLHGGASSIEFANGSTGRLSSNGTAALQQFQSRMTSSMSADRRLGSEVSQDATSRFGQTAGQSDSYRTGDSSTLNRVSASDSTRGNFQNVGTQAQTGQQATTGGSYGTNQRIGTSIDGTSGFTTGVGAQDAVGINGQFGVGIGRTAAPSAGVAPGQMPGGAPGPGARSPGMDDYGNAIPPAGGGAGGAGPSPRAGGADKPSKGGGLGRFIQGGLGFSGSSQKTYGASHNQNKSVSVGHGEEENAATNKSYATTGGRTSSAGTGSQSSQNSRVATDAARSTVSDRSSVRQVSGQTENSVSDRAGRSEANSFTYHRDLMADPNFLEKVAARNGMTAARFMGQNSERMEYLMQQYADEKGLVVAAKSMPPTGIEGASIPKSRSELEERVAKERDALPSSKDIDKDHKKRKQQTGAGSVAPVQANTAVPSIFGTNKAAVDGQLDPRSKDSIPGRAAAHDENIKAWASPDKQPGEGRANPTAVVEKAEIRDVVDTGRKGWDLLTGGDGTADGERLSDNMKREGLPAIKINKGGQ